MFCEQPTTQNSPPLGVVTVTAGGVKSSGIDAAVPITEDKVLLLQSRSTTLSIVSVPVPELTPLTATLNIVPLVELVPHGGPSVTSSAVYEPPPWSMTLKLVVPPPEA